MRSFWATTGHPYDHPSRIHPALNSFADECCGLLARLVAYVGVLALLAIAGVHLWDQLPDGAGLEPAAKASNAGWVVAGRSYPAFAVSQFDFPGKTESYEILRHPEGGRKDIFRWATLEEQPVARLEIYRPGGELNPGELAGADRSEIAGGRELEAAGLIESKFGAVTLFRAAGQAEGARPCLGFIKRFDQPRLAISGWSCQGDAWPARRAAIGCMLNRLVLLTAGNDPKLAELFARAELKRGNCPAAATPAASADWVTAAEDPRLRGAF